MRFVQVQICPDLGEPTRAWRDQLLVTHIFDPGIVPLRVDEAAQFLE